MDYITYKIFNDIVLGYTLSTLLFLLICRFSYKLRSIKFEYLEIANCLILVLSIIFYILYCILVVKNSSSNENNLSSNNHKIERIVFTTISILLIPLLFLYRKLRQNFFVIGIVMLSLIVFTNYEKAVIMITSFYRDYLPSNWSVKYQYTSYVKIGLSAIIYFILVLLGIRLRKTKT
jgi:hypothetical protein